MSHLLGRRLMGWGFDNDYLTEFVSSTRPINDDAELFAELERAEHAAWEKIRKRQDLRRAQ